MVWETKEVFVLGNGLCIAWRLEHINILRVQTGKMGGLGGSNPAVELTVGRYWLEVIKSQMSSSCSSLNRGSFVTGQQGAH
jgi:hypothetical protein